jgi:uncharacterized protein (DUF488 family)
MKLYTIGHGNLELEAFLHIIRSNDVKWLADVRSAPHSARFPWFNKRELAEALESAGIRYLYMGSKLGGKPRAGEVNDEWKQGRLNPSLVSTLSRTKRWSEGIAYLSHFIKATDEYGEAGCMMCSEKDPSNCHRSLLSFNLQEALPDLSIAHLSHDSTATEATFQVTLMGMDDGQRDYH